MSNGAPQASDTSYIMSQAVFHNNIALLEELLDNGIDPNFPNSYGDCPLHEAAQYGQRESVSLLLTHKGKSLYVYVSVCRVNSASVNCSTYGVLWYLWNIAKFIHVHVLKFILKYIVKEEGYSILYILLF